MNAKKRWVMVAVLVMSGLMGLTGCGGEVQPLGDVRGGSAGSSGSGGGASMSGGSSNGSGGGVASCETPCFRNIVSSNAVSCKICHGAVVKLDMGSLDLESPGISARLKDAPAEHKGVPAGNGCPQGDKLIDSAFPQNSWLLKKVLGQQGRCGTVMPSTGALTVTDQLCMQTYVNCVAGW